MLLTRSSCSNGSNRSKGSDDKFNCAGVCEISCERALTIGTYGTFGTIGTILDFQLFDHRLRKRIVLVE